MNIDYDKIITKANARKEKLQELSMLLSKADDMVNQLQAIHKWVEELRVCYSLLDAEGKSLLPAAVQSGLFGIADISQRLGYAYSFDQGYGPRGLDTLTGK
jgi:hypothetical protein